jgi:hypothetical protein
MIKKFVFCMLSLVVSNVTYAAETPNKSQSPIAAFIATAVGVALLQKAAKKASQPHANDAQPSGVKTKETSSEYWMKRAPRYPSTDAKELRSRL